MERGTTKGMSTATPTRLSRFAQPLREFFNADLLAGRLPATANHGSRAAFAPSRRLFNNVIGTMVGKAVGDNANDDNGGSRKKPCCRE